MPITASAKKALRSSKKKAVVNSRVKSRVKTFVDTMIKEPTAQALSKAFSSIDRAQKSNLIPKNRASRIKKRLHKLIGEK